MAIRSSWKTHAMFACRDCDWTCGAHHSAVDKARRHCDQKGHSVQGETGYVVYYKPGWLPKTVANRK